VPLWFVYLSNLFFGSPLNCLFSIIFNTSPTFRKRVNPGNRNRSNIQRFTVFKNF
jgi:hypothetical protein